MANGTVEIQAFIEGHHKRCVAALQRIALLADTGSDVHKAAYRRQYDACSSPTSWQIMGDMRETANDVVGNLPLEESGRYDSNGHRDRCALIGLLVSRVLGMQDSSPKEVEEHVRAMLQQELAVDSAGDAPRSGASPDVAMTEDEKIAMKLLSSFWNAYVNLPDFDSHDHQQVLQSVHAIQGVMAVRVARRVNPEIWR